MQRLGLILPSSNTTVEREFSRVLCGLQVSIHAARIPLSQVTVKDLEAMEGAVQAAAKLLRDAAVDLAVFACTSGSLVKGLGYDELLSRQVSEAAGCRAVVTSSAVVQALKKLKAQRISLATPYIEEVNQKEADFLSRSGFEVVKTQSLGITDNLKIGNLTSSDAAVLAQKADSVLADTVFISCTNLQTFEAIPALEKQLAKPVISSNSATLWASLKALETKIPAGTSELFGTAVFS